jgi:small GTP-binding protein
LRQSQSDGVLISSSKHASSNCDYLIQILLIGDTSVGKSSLIHRYANGEFLESFVGTAGVDHKEKNIEHLSKGVKMRIWDSAGQERFRETTKSYFRRSVGIILVYDVTNARSFENIDYWL